nr:MAG TPA: hypothetical protein [Bacteriophage sp.]
MLRYNFAICCVIVTYCKSRLFRGVMFKAGSGILYLLVH